MRTSRPWSPPRQQVAAPPSAPASALTSEIQPFLAPPRSCSASVRRGRAAQARTQGAIASNPPKPDATASRELVAEVEDPDGVPADHAIALVAGDVAHRVL